MIKSTTAAIAALAILFCAGAASAQKVDANGKCHDASGKFAKAEVCGGASATKTAKTTTTTTKTTKTAKAAESATATATPAAATAPAAKTTTTTQKCKNDKGKYAKCGTPGAHPA